MAWLTGYPRERIAWFPTIDETKCVKCGMCMNCGKNVYDWTPEGAKASRPYQCVVGCSTCASLCLGNAITFPDILTVREIYKREGIWSEVKRQLMEEGRLEIKSQQAVRRNLRAPQL